MKFEPKDQQYRERVLQSFNRQKFMHFIHAELKVVRPGYCEIHLPFDEKLTQQHGFFHAGIIGTLADNAAGYAGFSLMENTSSVLTVEFKINLMSPGDGDYLVAKAEVLKRGRTLTICRSEVFTVKNGEERLCAAAQSTLMELKNRVDG